MTVNSYTSLIEKALQSMNHKTWDFCNVSLCLHSHYFMWSSPYLVRWDRSCINIPINIFYSYEWSTKNEEILCSRVWKRFDRRREWCWGFLTLDGHVQKIKRNLSERLLLRSFITLKFEDIMILQIRKPRFRAVKRFVHWTVLLNSSPVQFQLTDRLYSIHSHYTYKKSWKLKSPLRAFLFYKAL